MTPHRPEVDGVIDLGKPRDWDEAANGPCQPLPVVVDMSTNVPSMTSYWVPTPEEIAMLEVGGKVALTVYGIKHPPVWVGVQP